MILPNDPYHIEQMAERLRQGRLVSMPTETVYGLAADCENNLAVAEIFSTKGRPQFNPLIVHVTSLHMAERYGVFSETAKQLAKTFWPGPLTLVVKRTADCKASLLVSAGLDTIAIRSPHHIAAQQLIRAVGKGLAAPSANKSGHVSPTLPQHVLEELGEEIPVIDGGPCQVGIESTVIDMTGEHPLLLRPGSITEEEIVGSEISILPTANRQPPTGVFRAPGQLESHYAPSLPVRLNVTEPQPGEALLAFGTDTLGSVVHMMNLSPQGDLTEAAANLFAMLRQLDRPELYKAIAVMPIPETGIGIAINDRLRRAATGR